MSAVCGIVAWQVPAMTDDKVITAYNIIFSSTTTNQTVLVSKNSDNFFHVIREKDWPDQDKKYQASIKVRSRMGLFVRSAATFDLSESIMKWEDDIIILGLDSYRIHFDLFC